MTHDFSINRIFIILIFYFYTANSYSQNIQITTFNTGLAPSYVEYSEARIAPITQNLKKLKSEVICLQEVWGKSDQEFIKDDLKKLYPYSYSQEIKNKPSEKTPTCSISDLFGEDALLACMLKKCKGQSNVTCTTRTCYPNLMTLVKINRECSTALMAQVGKNTLIAILNLLNPLSPAGLFAFKGSNGLLLLSKHPFEKTSSLDFSEHSTLNRRGALTADIKINSKLIHVVCTHLTAKLDSAIPYTGTNGSWESENLIQLKNLAQYSKQHPDPVVIMGDFNTGPGLNSLDPALPKNFDYISGQGFKNAHIELNNIQCSHCSTNNLTKSKHNILIDHIFYSPQFKALNSVYEFKSVFIKLTDVPKPIPLSDHYGLSATLKLD